VVEGGLARPLPPAVWLIRPVQGKSWQSFPIDSCPIRLWFLACVARDTAADAPTHLLFGILWSALRGKKLRMKIQPEFSITYCSKSSGPLCGAKS
jgi:hypothetical protein